MGRLPRSVSLLLFLALKESAYRGYQSEAFSRGCTIKTIARTSIPPRHTDTRTIARLFAASFGAASPRTRARALAATPARFLHKSSGGRIFDPPRVPPKQGGRKGHLSAEAFVTIEVRGSAPWRRDSGYIEVALLKRRLAIVCHCHVAWSKHTHTLYLSPPPLPPSLTPPRRVQRCPLSGHPILALQHFLSHYDEPRMTLCEPSKPIE